MSDATRLALARFRDETRGGDFFPVHFNPESLTISLTNTLDSSEGSETRQHVGRSNASLSMDLVFDTTGSGTDVRDETGRIAAFMKPTGIGQSGGVPSVVLFEWGSFAFKGIVKSYSEVIDFFSASGVPLRATVQLSLDQQEVVFANQDGGASAGFSASVGLGVSGSVDVSVGAGVSVTGVAAAAGNASAGRAMAAANGLDSMRFPAGSLTVDSSVSLSGPTAFASGGAGIGVGGSAGVGGGLGVSAGAGAGAGGSASPGPSFGASASAGVSASQGAFAGLSGGEGGGGGALDPSRLLPKAGSSQLAIDARSGFDVAGRMQAGGSGGLQADVGTSPASKIRFDFEG